MIPLTQYGQVLFNEIFYYTENTVWIIVEAD